MNALISRFNFSRKLLGKAQLRNKQLRERKEFCKPESKIRKITKFRNSRKIPARIRMKMMAVVRSKMRTLETRIKFKLEGSDPKEEELFMMKMIIRLKTYGSSKRILNHRFCIKALRNPPKHFSILPRPHRLKIMMSKCCGK